LIVANDSINELSKIISPISDNILNLLLKVKDVEVCLRTSSCSNDTKGFITYLPVRERAKKELEKRGNPPYVSSAFLNKNSY
jgi:hypothetical protein